MGNPRPALAIVKRGTVSSPYLCRRGWQCFASIRHVLYLHSLNGKRCGTRSKGLLCCRENFFGLDSHRAGLDRHRIRGQPLRPVFPATHCKRIPPSHPRYWTIRLVWSNLGGFGCRRHPQFCSSTLSTDSRAKIRHLDTGTCVERCCSAGTAVGWRRNRPVRLSGGCALAEFNSQLCFGAYMSHASSACSTAMLDVAPLLDE